jgi:integral membrane protein (TIGR01906 family)
LPLALITTNIRAAFSEQRVYDYAVRNFGAEEASGIPESELIRANAQLVRYLTADDPSPLSISVVNNRGEEEALFTPREIAHMADVRGIVQSVFKAQIATVAFVLTLAVVMLLLWPPRALAAAALYGSLTTGALIGLVGFIALSGFDSAWSGFHNVLFSNDFWRLDPSTHHLIQMYPEAFWLRVTIALGAATLLEAALIALISGVYLLLSRPGEEEPPVEKPVAAVPGPAGHSRPRVAPPNPRHYIR